MKLLLNKFGAMIAIVLLAAVTLLVQSKRLEAANTEITFQSNRAVQAEQNLAQLTVDLKQAEDNYQLYLTRFKAEQLLVDQLSTEREVLHEQLETKTRELSSAFSQLKSNDKTVHDWSDEPVPDGVVSLLRKAAETTDNHADTNGVRNAENSSAFIKTNFYPLARNTFERGFIRVHERSNFSVENLQL